MIRGVHTMYYTSEPDRLRAFIRDKLGFAATDLGEGWLIFDLPEAEMGCHPADIDKGAPSGTHNISFYCDDVVATVAELKSKGVKFVDEISDQGYGLVTHFEVPGGFTVQLYQPRYEMRRAAKRPKKKAAAKKSTKRLVRKATAAKKRKR